MLAIANKQRRRTRVSDDGCGQSDGAVGGAEEHLHQLRGHRGKVIEAEVGYGLRLAKGCDKEAQHSMGGEGAAESMPPETRSKIARLGSHQTGRRPVSFSIVGLLIEKERERQRA